MPMEMYLMRVDAGKAAHIPATMVPLESELEAIIVSQPDILGESLLIVGKQVKTDRGGIIDVLAIDVDGILHVIELKRDKTPRDVVAQTLDYAAWVSRLTRDDVVTMYEKTGANSLEEGFSQVFGGPLPEEINSGHELTIVAGSMDPATENIIEYLAGFLVPINVLFFRYFVDDGRKYLARSWMLDPSASDLGNSTASSKKQKEQWNKRDWYVNFGTEGDTRNWDDAQKYGFVSGGQGSWYSRTIRQLPVGARVFTYIPKSGYVGIGEVITPAAMFEEAIVEVDGKPAKLADLELQGEYGRNDTVVNEDDKEWVVGVRWRVTVDQEKAFKISGLFSNTNTACKLTNSFTIGAVEDALNYQD